jgi:hypothetical protein
VGLVLAGAGPASAQESCEFIDPGNDVLVQRPPFAYVTNPHLRCEGGVEIWADSAVVNRDQSMTLLIGSVRYADASRELSALEARYFYEVGRLQARGRVLVTNYEDGSIVENGDLVYLRQTDYRDIEEMSVRTGADGLRPRATVYPSRAAAPVDSTTIDPAAAAGDPEPDLPDPPEVEEPAEPQQYIVVGDSIFFRGDSYFHAAGTVEIERDSLFAFADAAEYAGEVGQLVLDGSARVESSTYDLVGRLITLTSAADGTDEVRAVRDAVLTGEDLEVTAEQIVVHLNEGALERMVAVPIPPDSTSPPPATAVAPPVRPVAIAQDFELTGDSLDLAAPGGVPERIFAAGRARSVSSGRPELNVEGLPDIARTDWIDADTIEVLLLPAPADQTSADGDSTSAYEVDRILARVDARSLYRLVPNDSLAVVGVDLPAVSYMVADQITIFMVDGQAERVESVGEVSGWHLEPIRRAPAEPTDAATRPAPTGNGGDVSPPDAYLFPGP